MGLFTIRYWLLILFSTLHFLTAKAQLPGMRIYTQLDGYPGTMGYHIMQDPRGFIWVATDNGAVCFDSRKFRVIDDEDGLADKEILHAIPCGEENVLLVPLLNNIALYKNGKVTTAIQNKKLGRIANKVNNVCRFDKVTGKVWLGDARNYNNILYCITGDSIQEVKINVGYFEHIAVINNRLYLLLIHRNNSRKHFAVYDLNRHTTEVFKFADEKGKAIDLNTFTNVKISDDGKYLVGVCGGTNLEVFEIRGNELYYKRTAVLAQPPRFLFIDKNNHLWVALSTSGIEYWGKLPGSDMQTRPLYFLENTVINALLVDREGHLWFTTEQKGLCFISAKHWESARLTLRLNLPPYPARYIAGDGKGSIYIGHSGKSYFTRIKNGKSTVFNIPEGSPLGARAIVKLGEHIFVASNVLAMFHDTNRGISYKGLWRHGSIKDIAVYNDKQLILAEHGCVTMVKIKDLDKMNKDSTIFEGRASSVEVLRDRSLLVGTPNGLFLKPSLYKPAIPVNTGALKTVYITCIKNARGSFVLVGTNAKGLHIYNALTGGISRVPFPANGNPASIRHIFRQNDSLYWISTNAGVKRIYFDTNMQVKNITAYTFFDGLPSNNATSMYVQNDTAYIATAEGLGILPLKNPVTKNEAPKLWLTSIKIEDSLVYFPKGNINLTHDQNNIQLYISALSYESIGKMKLTYRLQGLSEKWIETENPEISFSGLSPGNYLFEVYTVNFKGIRSGSPLQVAIVVHPAFWQTTWFKILLFILAAALVLFIVYRIVADEKNKQYNKMQQKKRLAELELEAIKAQINPHFVYNCLNSIQYFSYKNDMEAVKQYLDIFAKLIRQTMQYSQETFITLEEDINYLNNYLKLEKVRFKDKLNYQLEVEQGIDRSTMIPSMLVQPYVENALKHGVAKLEDTGEVWIKITHTPEDCLQVTIEDNGPGLHSEITDKSRKPLGMRISGSRAETYNQLFGLGISVSFEPRERLDDGRTKGTRVKLLIPLIKHGSAIL